MTNHLNKKRKISELNFRIKKPGFQLETNFSNSRLLKQMADAFGHEVAMKYAESLRHSEKIRINKFSAKPENANTPEPPLAKVSNG